MSEQLSQAQLTAPETIYLQHNDSGYMDEPFPADHSGTSWCDEEVFNCDVRYVRADLAEGKQAEQQARIAELERQAAIGRRAVEMLREIAAEADDPLCHIGKRVSAILRDAEQAGMEVVL